MSPADPINQWLEAHSNPAPLPVRVMDVGPAAREALDAEPTLERQLRVLEEAMGKLQAARDDMASLEDARTAGLNLGWRAGSRFTLWWALPAGMLLGACLFAAFALLGARS